MANFNLIISTLPQNHTNRHNLTGQRFGRLLVLGLTNSYQKRRMWHCLCDCGILKLLPTCALSHTGRSIQSCGCLRSDKSKQNKTHGLSVNGINSVEYRAYRRAKDRCQNSRNPKYPRYGGRGIKFRFTNPLDFIAEVGLRPSPQHSLNRINNDGHYEIGNIEWATAKEQARNVSTNRILTAFGKTQTLTAFAEEYGLDMHCLYARIMAYHWCLECALTIPSTGKGRSKQRCSHKTKP